MSDLKYTFSSSFMSFEEVIHNFLFCAPLDESNKREKSVGETGKRQTWNIKHQIYGYELLHSRFLFNATQIIFLWCQPVSCVIVVCVVCDFMGKSLHFSPYVALTTTYDDDKVGIATANSKLFSAFAIRWRCLCSCESLGNLMRFRVD